MKRAKWFFNNRTWKVPSLWRAESKMISRGRRRRCLLFSHERETPPWANTTEDAMMNNRWQFASRWKVARTGSDERENWFRNLQPLPTNANPCVVVRRTISEGDCVPKAQDTIRLLEWFNDEQHERDTHADPHSLVPIVFVVSSFYLYNTKFSMYASTTKVKTRK